MSLTLPPSRLLPMPLLLQLAAELAEDSHWHHLVGASFLAMADSCATPCLQVVCPVEGWEHGCPTHPVQGGRAARAAGPEPYQTGLRSEICENLRWVRSLQPSLNLQFDAPGLTQQPFLLTRRGTFRVRTWQGPRVCLGSLPSLSDHRTDTS